MIIKLIYNDFNKNIDIDISKTIGKIQEELLNLCSLIIYNIEYSELIVESNFHVPLLIKSNIDNNNIQDHVNNKCYILGSDDMLFNDIFEKAINKIGLNNNIEDIGVFRKLQTPADPHPGYTLLGSAVSEYLKCNECNVTNNNHTNIVYCSYCELMSELREESRKILKLKVIMDFLKKISTKERPKEYLESLIEHSIYFIYISKKNINYPEHIKILFTNILHKNYYPFYEYFKNKDLKNEVQYFLPNNLNYCFIFLNIIILFYLKKGWGWDITLFPSDKSKIIQFYAAEFFI